MFLTKKSFRKIVIMSICYLALGIFFIVGWFAINDAELSTFSLVAGIIICLLSVPFYFSKRYTEGAGKLVNLGNRLVRKELNPMEFIRYYDFLKSSDDLVVNKPSLEVLQLVLLAYDSLGENEKALETVNEMIFVSGNKKKAYSNLLKVSLLYSSGDVKEAEELFNQIQKQKLDVLSTVLVDTILKSDRAFAMGDYKTVEMHLIKSLEQKFPKLDNLTEVIAHYKLGEVYQKLNENQKAAYHYGYCANFGGQTQIRKIATEKMELINRQNLQC